MPSRAGGGWVEERCFRPAPGLGSGVGEEVRQRRWGSEGNLLLSARGLGWALGVRETCNGPGTRARCHLVTAWLPRPLASEVPGFVCSYECPGVAASQCGSVPPP